MKIKAYMKEFQYRLFFAFFTFILNTFMIYYFKEELIFLLAQHQNTNFPHFITTNLPEVFFCFIKLSVFLGLYFAFPILLFQCWFFFCPALYKYEYEITKNFLLISICLFVLGTFSVYKVLLPYCWTFFSAFELNYEESGVNIQLETRLHEYLNFFIQLLYTLNITIASCIFIGFLLFKFPISTLIKLRKIVYLLCFVAATVITPPDITSQLFTGLVLVFVYESFMFSLFLTQEYKKGE